MKTLLLEKLEADVYKARYASFQEVEMGEGIRRHDQELNQTARGHPTLNAHVPQDNGTYEANEKQDLSTS
jgi:hypothetical protein